CPPKLSYNVLDSPRLLRARYPFSNSAPAVDVEANPVVNETFGDQMSLPFSSKITKIPINTNSENCSRIQKDWRFPVSNQITVCSGMALYHMPR
ncbi:hypothetical protein HAX54_028957, partial [Datura stramonium]|nr:hypothetical protein [Datura stramonium]